ncbi:centromere protein R isoform X2 [Bubalus bubalis]|uniref:centromere protein R isoform X2 n=1 Tax=Bubalus bubalis TaxID=89462 RepID=UPI001E1B919A|nr:centromere protein R isoform X2 [Bubalus bubalis]
MPVKRSLKLDGMLKANSFGSPKITRKKSAADYSPTTGTCQMSPIASPTSSKEQENRNGPSNGKRKNLNHLSINKRMESTMQDNEFMVLLSKVEKSSEEFMEIMQNALKGSKELENLIGIPHASCVFKREMQKTKKLMTNVIKQKLFKKKNSGLPNKGQEEYMWTIMLPLLRLEETHSL